MCSAHIARADALTLLYRSSSEWRNLASWVVDNVLISPQVRWMIQVRPNVGRRVQSDAVTATSLIASMCPDPTSVRDLQVKRPDQELSRNA
jgi:adenosine deaminase